MFKAVGRYFRALGYLVTGRIDAARRAVSTSPYAVNATYDQIVEEKKRSVRQFKDAIARLIVQHDEKMNRVRTLTEDINRLEQLKEGAAAKARTTVEQLRAQGMDIATIKAGEDYQKCMMAFNDFNSRIEEKTPRITELEKELSEMDQTIQGHKLQLQQMLREIDRIKEEQAVAVAEIITAREEQDLNDMLTGISKDRTSRDLAEMRQLRDEMKAKARVSRELAGTDTKVQEAQFLEYAKQHKTSDEFDRLIGLAESADQSSRSTDPEKASEPRLPE